MKKHILLFACLSLLMFSCKDGDDKGTIAPVSNPSSQPYLGGVILTWTNPTAPDYYCTLVTYQNAAGETVKKKISHFDSKDGVTTTTITGFEDTSTYTFTLTAYNVAGATSTPVTVQGTPQDASMAYFYIVDTVTSTPGFQGATINWENEYLVPAFINISYTDVSGTVVSNQYDASTSGSVALGGIMTETPVTITTENRNGDKSQEKVYTVLPATTKGELSQSLMSIYAISSVWQDFVGERMLDGNVNSYWHALTDPGLWPHWFVVDLGASYMVDWVELVRRQWDDGNGQWCPTKVQFQYSLDGENFTDLTGPEVFEREFVYGHTYTFPEVYARYIKVLCLEGQQNWTHMAEFVAYYGSANKYATEAAIERTPPEPDDDDTDEIFEDEFEYFTFSGAVNDMTLTQSETNKYEYQVVTTGGDAYCPITPLARKNVGPMLVFRYKSTDAFTGEFFWCDAGGGAAGGRQTNFPVPANTSGEWKTFRINLANAMAQHNWAGNVGDFVRFDFEGNIGMTIDIKNIHFRPLRESEQ